MSEQTAEQRNLSQRLASQTEEALGRIVQDLLENQVVNSALTRVFEAREKATHAQQVAMGALNLPSAVDLERLTRRLRSVSQRLEGIEDSVDKLDGAVGKLSADRDVAARLTAIEEQLAQLTRMLASVRAALPGADAQVSIAQERLAVDDGEEHAAADPEVAHAG